MYGHATDLLSASKNYLMTKLNELYQLYGLFDDVADPGADTGAGRDRLRRIELVRLGADLLAEEDTASGQPVVAEG